MSEWTPLIWYTYDEDLSMRQRRWIEINMEYAENKDLQHMNGSNLVPGRGLLDEHGIVFVGEAPGEEEDKLKAPFVGKSGQILNGLLDKVLKLPRDLVYVTNIVKFRPVGPLGENRTPTTYELIKSIPSLTNEINLLNPKVIVPMGRIATRAFFPDLQIKRIRGKVMERRGRLIIPTYHPAAMIYNPPLEGRLIEQFETIRDVLK